MGGNHYGTTTMPHHNPSSDGGDEETASLLADGVTPRHFETKPIMCWSNPPPVVSRMFEGFTLEKSQVLVIFIIMLIAAIVFAVHHEEHESGHLTAISSSSPLIIPFDLTSSNPVLEVVLGMQHVYEPDYPSPTWLSVTVEGNQQRDLIDFPWEHVSNMTLEGESEEQDHIVHDFYLDDRDLQETFVMWRVVLRTNSERPLAVSFHYRMIGTLVRYQVGIAALVLVGVYVLIIFELMHRTISALIGSFVCLAFLTLIHARPSFFEVISWIDFDTCGLLFGMMIMVGIFSNTGFFEFSAVKAYKLSRGNLWHLTVILCVFTAGLSAFLDNVTTVLLLVPVTIRLCKVLDIPPEPLIIAEVMFSNIGGTATPIGDPPNIIIVNHPRITRYPNDITFFKFTVHIAPGVIIAGIAVFAYMYFMYKRNIKRVPHHGKLREVEIWRRTASRINPNSGQEEGHVKGQLEAYLRSLEEEIASTPIDDSVKSVDITELEEKYIIHDQELFIISTAVLTAVVLMFFAHSWVHEYVDLSLAWIAIIGAMVHLVVAGIHDVEEILEKVELSTLLFFAGLFVLMHGLEKLGLIYWIGVQVSSVIAIVPEGIGRQLVAVLLIVWVSAFASAFIDNIPYTTAMVPIVVSLAEGDLGLPLTPLVYALVYGACLGGNGTLIGASANVVACGLAEGQGYPISFNMFFKTGMPIMIISVFVSSIYLVVTHVFIPWR